MDFKEYLESIGDSIVCVADDDVVKVHVYTNDPGLAIQRALKYGQLSNLKIDNMRLEHQEKLFKMSEKENAQPGASTPAEPPKPIGFLAVSVGDGVNEIFKSLGVDYIIEGGQTMNPSTEDMLNAIDKVNAETIYILPNNKNIILAANQAQALVEDKDIRVIPTKTVPQGITAVINYTPGASGDENEEAMTEEILLPEPYTVITQAEAGVNARQTDETGEKHTVILFEIFLVFVPRIIVFIHLKLRFCEDYLYIFLNNIMLLTINISDDRRVVVDFNKSSKIKHS
jgi:dihydroxyacetone kinase-like predicted kinase